MIGAKLGLSEAIANLRSKADLDVTRDRGYTPSEVLLVEALHLAIQERWHPFAYFLIWARLIDSRAALLNARKVHLAIGNPSALIERIIAASEAMRGIRRGILPSIRQVRKEPPDKADPHFLETAYQLIALIHDALGKLPDSVAQEVDAALCESHRARVVLGQRAVSESRASPRLHKNALLGLALSGGGIRSASFSIGVLQELAKQAVLPAFNYISSVSGGGYAASWYMAWAYRHQNGTEGVKVELSSSQAWDGGPLWWIRRHVSYLAPRLSFASMGDVIALVVAYVFNWIPVFALICLAIATTLIVPHVIAEWAAALIHASPLLQSIALLAGLAFLVVLIGGLRRLTAYYRMPIRPIRPPSGLALVVTVWYTAIAVGIATIAPLLANIERSNLRDFLEAFEIASPRGFVALFSLWLFAYLAGILLAWILSRDAISHAIDTVRSTIFRQETYDRGRLNRLPVPLPLVIVGVALGAISGALSTDFLLSRTDGEGIERYVTVVGPCAILIVAGSELCNAFISNPYMREIDRAWSARVGAWMLSGAVLWLFASGISLFADEIYLALANLGLVAKVVLFILMSIIAAALIWRRTLVPIYLALTGIFLLAVSAAITTPIVTWWQAVIGPHVWFLFLLSSGLTLCLAALINVNRFSMHSVYREALVRTFLGASRLSAKNMGIRSPSGLKEGELPQFAPRHPDPITNIDDDDNPALAWMQSRPDRALPVFLLNAAVNGVSRGDVDGRAPRQWPYTFSQYFCGSPAYGVGYSPTEKIFSRRGVKSLTLGTAMAVSGAAVSPTAGISTHPVKAFVFGVLNARLGLWIGNPQYPTAVPLERPGLTGMSVLLEVLGVRRRFAKWIHLSDGGHFENLGVYELLRRGCSRIVAIDCSCDPDEKMSDLANAFRRARIDLGVVVRNEDQDDFMEDSPSRVQRESARWGDNGLTSPESDETREAACWKWYTIYYGENLPLGRLLYIKPSLKGTFELPIEVHQYAKNSPSFPHETTADQFFSEAQMEAYRALGQVCSNDALAAAIGFRNARKRSFDMGLAFLLPQRSKGRSSGARSFQ